MHPGFLYQDPSHLSEITATKTRTKSTSVVLCIEYRLKFSPHNQIMTKPLSEGNVRNVHSEAGQILIAIYSHQEWEGKKNPRVRERARSCRPLALEFATKSASSWACMDGCIMDCNDIHSPSFCCYPLLLYRKRSCPFMVFSRSTEHRTSIG
jgi:hypothetical protein